MSLPYSEPGVSVRELVSPNFGAPASSAPTSIALVGPARGYEEVVDTIALIDKNQVTLSRNNADLASIRVVDIADPNAAAFVESTISAGERDYTLDTTDLAATGVVRISRSMQTLIDDGEVLVTYFENSATPTQSDAATRTITLNRTQSALVDGSAGVTGVNGLEVDTEAASLRVQSKGEVPAGEVTIAGEGTGSPTITWVNVGGGQVIGKFQTIYADYSVGSDDYIDQPFQLNNTTPVALPANATDVVLKNAVGLGNVSADIDTVLKFTPATGALTDNDYLVTGSGLTLSVARSAGTTTMGPVEDEARVRVSYRAAPDEYWMPTRVFSQSDVERKFGPALDSAGNINSPLSFAAGLAFTNGATELTLQALFAPTSPKTSSTGSASDWASTLEELRVMEDVNVIVPILGVGGSVLTSNDSLVASIVSAVKSHIDYMAGVNQHVIAIAGTDSTTSGQGSRAARRSLSTAFNQEKISILSPAAYTYVNQLNRSITVGGQYAAACYAGMLGRYPIQQTLTRKTMLGLQAVVESVSPVEKDRDAMAGLVVLENKGGSIRVRHALTTSTASVATRELNVVRAKYYKMELIHQAIDQQIIGQINADDNAPFTVQVLIGGILESLASRGVIVTYSGLTARMSSANPTQVEVRYAYKPAFPLNYVSVEFNIDLSTGTVVLDESPIGA